MDEWKLVLFVLSSAPSSSLPDQAVSQLATDLNSLPEANPNSKSLYIVGHVGFEACHSVRLRNCVLQGGCLRHLLLTICRFCLKVHPAVLHGCNQAVRSIPIRMRCLAVYVLPVLHQPPASPASSATPASSHLPTSASCWGGCRWLVASGWWLEGWAEGVAGGVVLVAGGVRLVAGA